MVHRILPFAALLVVAGCGVTTTGGIEPLGGGDEPTGQTPASGAPKTPASSSNGKAPTPIQDVPVSEIPSAPPASNTPAQPMPTGEPATVISPFHPSGSLTYQRPIIWTISAFDAMTPIHYTTDGSAPDSSAQTGIGKVTLQNLAEGTRIRWVAATGSTIHEMTVHVDSSLATETHHIVENVRFTASGGPIVHVKPGATVAGKAGAAVWNGQSNCPTCIDQITLGISSAATCLVSVQPNTFPGSAGSDVSFSIKAPTAPGVYKMRTGFTQQYKCADAIGQALHDTEVGTIIVDLNP